VWVLIFLFCRSCGATIRLASDGGLTGNKSLPSALSSPVGASLLAKAFCQAVGFFLIEYISIPAAMAI
jgi:hypothetical protein